MTYAPILIRLRRSAREACKGRGHDMAPFQQHGGGLLKHKPRQYSECRRCHMWVEVNADPAPNEIDIGGSAVAVNCTA